LVKEFIGCLTTKFLVELKTVKLKYPKINFSLEILIKWIESS